MAVLDGWVAVARCQPSPDMEKKSQVENCDGPSWLFRALRELDDVFQGIGVCREEGFSAGREG